MQRQTINIKGRLVTLDKPIVMGIINVTPDSFFADSRKTTEGAIRHRIEEIIAEGGTIVDVGAYSSRPGASEVSTKEEIARLAPTLRILREDYPDIAVSVDTWRGDVARWAVEEQGVGLINDISAGELDKTMFPTVASLQVPYIMMHMRGTPQTMQHFTDYEDIGLEVLDYFIQKSETLIDLGLHDIIIDPGFGFAKTTEQNYQLLTYTSRLVEALGFPLLVGISRKSMIYKALDISPEESLNGTSILHTYALLNGASILRVHDVREAMEAITLVETIKQSLPPQENPVYHILNQSEQNSNTIMNER